MLDAALNSDLFFYGWPVFALLGSLALCFSASRAIASRAAAGQWRLFSAAVGLLVLNTINALGSLRACAQLAGWLWRQ